MESVRAICVQIWDGRKKRNIWYDSVRLKKMIAILLHVLVFLTTIGVHSYLKDKPQHIKCARIILTHNKLCSIIKGTPTVFWGYLREFLSVGRVFGHFRNFRARRNFYFWIHEKICIFKKVRAQHFLLHSFHNTIFKKYVSKKYLKNPKFPVFQKNVFSEILMFFENQFFEKPEISIFLNISIEKSF